MVLFIISFENLGSQYCLCIILLSGCCVYLPLPCVYYSSLAFSVCAYKRNLPSCWCVKSSLTSSDLFPSVEVASSGAIVAVISKSPQSSVVVSCSSLTPPLPPPPFAALRVWCTFQMCFKMIGIISQIYWQSDVILHIFVLCIPS